MGLGGLAKRSGASEKRPAYLSKNRTTRKKKGNAAPCVWEEGGRTQKEREASLAKQGKKELHAGRALQKRKKNNTKPAKTGTSQPLKEKF